MNEQEKAALLAQASPEARAGYEKLDKAGLLTDEMLEALAALHKRLVTLAPDLDGPEPQL